MNSLGPALHHLSEQGDAVQVDELLCKGDVPGCIGQVLQSFQLSIHARRLDPFMELDCGLVLEWENALLSEGKKNILHPQYSYALTVRTSNLQERWSSAGSSHS